MDSKQDLTDEKEQLDARLNHLTGQLASERFTTLPGEEQSRMALQRDIMHKYSEVLGERIRLYNDEAPTGEPEA